MQRSRSQSCKGYQQAIMWIPTRTYIQDLEKSMDLSEQIDLILLDFSKAFDKVPHERLLYKAQYYVISLIITTINARPKIIRNKPRKVYLYKKWNLDVVKEYLDSKLESFKETYKEMNIEGYWTTIKNPNIKMEYTMDKPKHQENDT